MPENPAKPKVLVADDERVIADTLAIILNQSGFDATAVYSGEKAVETAQTLRPDMLISDVIMNDLNGIDAAIKIRQILPTIKILLFSGQAATADLLEKARAQGDDFVDASFGERGDMVAHLAVGVVAGPVEERSCYFGPCAVEMRMNEMSA